MVITATILYQNHAARRTLFDHRTLESIRLMAVERVREGERASSVLASYGFNRTTIYKWLAVASGIGKGVRALRSATSLPNLCALIQFDNVCSTTPSDRATSATRCPDSTRRTASCLNSYVSSEGRNSSAGRTGYLPVLLQRRNLWTADI